MECLQEIYFCFSIWFYKYILNIDCSLTDEDAFPRVIPMDKINKKKRKMTDEEQEVLNNRQVSWHYDTHINEN
jgi:hypothetical protein